MNAPPEAAPRVPAAWSAAVGAAAFALAAAFAPAFPGDGDAGEFTLALALRGVPHPTGYPLYTLCGHAWAALLHALGLSWAHAANLWSAAGAGVAVGAVHALATRLAPAAAPLDARGRALLALAPAALLLGDGAFLREASVAEVGSWHLAILALAALAAGRVLEALAAPEPAPEPALRGRLFALGLALGAGFAHHATVVWFAVPLVAVVIVARVRARRLAFATTLAAWGGFVLPLLAHAHTAWRAWHPAAFQWPLLEPSWASVLEHVSGRVFAVYLGRFAPSPEESAVLRTAILPLALPGAAAAAWVLARERTSPRGLLLGALVAGALLQLAFVLRYGVPDAVPYFLPLLLPAVLALGAAAAPLARAFARPAALAAVGLALALWTAFGAQAVAAHHRHLALVADTIRARWEALPFERGIVLWNSDHYSHLVILGLLEGRKPQVIVDDPANLTWPAARRAFARRTGADPLAGLALRDDSQLGEIAPNVARRQALPVVDFARWRPDR